MSQVVCLDDRPAVDRAPTSLWLGRELVEPPHERTEQSPTEMPMTEAEIWRRFQRPLIDSARHHLGHALASKLDPEEIVQSVFGLFFKRIHQGKFVLRDWEHTQHLLVRLTHRYCSHVWKYYHAACRDVRREVASTWPAMEANPQQAFLAQRALPEDELLLAEAFRRLLTRFTKSRQKVVVRMALHGWNTREISMRIHLTRRTVQQVLRRVRRHLRQMDHEEK